MKKLVSFLVLAIMLFTPFVAVSANPTGTVIEWDGTGGDGVVTGYFNTTGSGIVHMWSDHPSFGPTHWVAKPLSVFEDAAMEGCDEGAFNYIASWYPINIRINALTVEDVEAYDSIFAEGENYFLCMYPKD